MPCDIAELLCGIQAPAQGGIQGQAINPSPPVCQLVELATLHISLTIKAVHSSQVFAQAKQTKLQTPLTICHTPPWG